VRTKYQLVNLGVPVNFKVQTVANAHRHMSQLIDSASMR